MGCDDNDLFGWGEGYRRQREGAELAREAQDDKSPGWSQRALEAVIRVARTQATVHVDDVLKIFVERPVHHNAWGSVWAFAKRHEWIVATGEMRRTSDPQRRRLYPVYRSTLYGGAK